MARMLIWFLLIYVGYRVVKGMGQKKEGSSPTVAGPVKEETFRDPVCGVYVTEEDAVIGRLEGERIHFCSMACLEKYREKIESR
ncbi:transcriptional regulator [Geobacter sp.]|uniref:transcriptional regulator n=1 Tax=Geobacter sp. TaxID=46610 RepID=UPI0026286BAF|nr:transcriptional regulator [Geobacter sp.]